MTEPYYISTSMSRSIQKKSSLLFVAVIAFIFVFAPVGPARAQGITNTQIEKLLLEYSEPGYKFLDKLDTGMWKVFYTRAGWTFGYEIVVISTDPDPGKSLIVIGTTVLSTETVTGDLLYQLLDENSLDPNPGNYSIFFDNGVYSVQYSVKIPQSLMNGQVLMDIIGYVAGYTNSRIPELEKMLTAPPGAAPPAEEEQAPAEGAPADAEKPKNKLKIEKDEPDPEPQPEKEEE